MAKKNVRDLMIEDFKKVKRELIESCHISRVTRDYYINTGKFTRVQIDREFNSFTNFALISEGYLDPETIEMTVKLAKQKQKLQDVQRVERKAFRDASRIDIYTEEYEKELVTLLKQYDLSKLVDNKKIIKLNNKICGVVSLSDPHFDELVLDYGSLNNTYNWQASSKRLQKFCYHIKKLFLSYDINNIVLVGLGDFLNNDSIPDKSFNNITHKSKATVLAVYLLEQFILDLLESFKITVATVSGNESRVLRDHTFSESLATHNYDFTIHNMLKMLFRSCKNINFIEGSYKEKVINVCNSNILILHGDTVKGNVEKWVQDTIARYAVAGIKVDYVLFGHIHSTYISDFFSRSGSLVGSNDYSSKALNLISKASQNCHIVIDDGTINSYKIDLQTYKDIEGYKIIDDLEAYTPKNNLKVEKEKKIYKIFE